jgi:hypothetical protein
VAASSIATNNTVILWTVTAGKTLFVSYANLVLYARDVSLSASFFVRNVADVQVYAIFSMASGLLGHMACPACFNPPLEIPAGFDICLSSNSALLNSYGFLHGREE